MKAHNWTIGQVPNRPGMKGKAAAVIAALLYVLIITLVSARPAYAVHDGLYVVCPDPITEGESASMRVRKSGHIVYKVDAYTHFVGHSADRSDFEFYEGVEFKHKSGSKSVYVPVITKEDSSPEINETFAIGIWDSGVWHGCDITIVDDDMPEITSVVVTSIPVAGKSYRIGESIDITVTLDQEVEVDGTPKLSLFVGDGDSSNLRRAEYLTGSGGKSLIFRYQVQAGDIDNDGISVGAGSTADDRSPANGFSGKIYAKGTKAQIDYTHSGIKNADKHFVDGRPYVQSVAITSAPPNGWEAYRANQIIELTFTFNTHVEVRGNVSADILVGLKDNNWDEARRSAQYGSGSGTDTLVFRYTVQPGDMDRNGVGIAGGGPERDFGGGGTIVAEGTDVAHLPGYLGKDHSPGQKVDTAAPAISSITLESQPGNGEAYAVGETIRVAAVFSEKVTITGDPHLELDIGGVTRQATVTSDAPRSASASQRGYGENIVFQYQVVAEDTDSDGVGISANSLKLNGGGIYDSAGNASGTSHEAVAADPAQKAGGSE